MRSSLNVLVQCKAAGDRVVSLFHQGACLDYKPTSPDDVKIHVGACKHHTPNLHALYTLLRVDGIITSEKIRQAKLDC